MRRGLLAAIGICAAIGFAAGPAGAAEIERFTVMSSGEVVGSLVASIDGPKVDISYDVSNNGRGPKLTEHLELQKGLPVTWAIDGNTAFGGTVHERYAWTDGQASWESQADAGSVAAARPRLYIPNDASPWNVGLSARALLAAPGGTLDVVPNGRLHIELLEETTIGGTPVRVYSMSGLAITPEMVVLDREGRLFALPSAGSSVVLRAGHEGAAPELTAIARRVQMAQLAQLQQRLARHFDEPVRIRNVHVFDPDAGSTGPLMDVVVYRNRIASVRAETAEDSDAGEVVIDGGGGTLIPGLHDMHSHLNGWSALLYLAAGVTTIRDLGNDNTQLLELVRRIDAGELPGPRTVRAGLIEGRSPYSARIGVIAESLDQALAQVRWYADHGYRHLKIYNSMNPDWVKPMAAEAHRLGLRVSGHVPAFMSPDRAIEDGYDEINHINQLVLGWILGPEEDTRTPLRLTAIGDRAYTVDVASDAVQHTLALFRSHHTALDTTAVILERLMLSRAGQVSAGDAPYLDHVPVGYQRYRKRSFVAFKSPEHEATYVKSFRKLLDVIAYFHQQGVQLLPGTDDGTGFTVHRELELYVQAGVPVVETLRLATLRADEYLGLDQQQGRIGAGRLADFVLLEGDPTADISAVRRARMVVKDGAIYFPSEIYQAVGIQPFTTPPAITGGAAH